MLVLSRKVGQELIIGDNIRITVNKVSGNRVTIGISAPSDVRIVRGELEPHGTADAVDQPAEGTSLSDRMKAARQSRPRSTSSNHSSTTSAESNVPEHCEPPANGRQPLDPVKEARGRLAPWKLNASHGADEVGRQAK